MSAPADLELARRAAALRGWTEASQKSFNEDHRYPEIDFGSGIWRLRSTYKTKIEDISFASTLRAFEGMDDSYLKAIRCLTAELAIADKVKQTGLHLGAWRLLTRAALPSLLDLKSTHLQAVEASVIQECRESPDSASRFLTLLQNLARFVDRLARLGVIAPASWSVSHTTRKALLDLTSQCRREFRAQKATILDRQIEALSDATRAMVNADPRLSASDRAALAIMGVLMCAPSRVNEPMCMSVDDLFTLEDYAKRPEGQQGSDELGRIHMLLLQKGSKGAAWGAKPALTFMISLLKQCMQILIEGGTRSRMLAAWYEQNPGKLYLPPTLEHLRGQVIDRPALWQIVNLTDETPSNAVVGSIQPLLHELKTLQKVQKIPNPRQFRKNGSRTSVKSIWAVAWDDLEPVLLRRVHGALGTVRRVTSSNHYDGQVSKMLMLFDSDETPYLPDSFNYPMLARRLKLTGGSEARHRENRDRTVFEKLDIMMVVDGRVEHAWLETHDPRRWLTTQALQARERLSDILINKWANRVCIEQLKNYDLRTDTQKADQAAMPEIKELADLSSALQRIEGLEAQYGLRTEIVTVNDAGVSMTSMEAITMAVEDRPVARTANQIIVIYPTRYGACVHQHHETPCRAFSCLPCNEHNVIKGHLPTNDQVRKRDEQLTRSIVTQLERLVTAHNREIADSPEGLEDHMLVLVREGLSPEQMADELITHFHEIKDRIKSASFKLKMEEAFVARGMVQRLDDPDVASGALIRYHNPARHAAPGHERALDALGGRVAIDASLHQFHLEHPQFAPTSLGLRDQRELLEQDDEDSNE